MSRIGMGELVVILVIVLVLFGAARLPEIGRSLGKAIKEFKKASREFDDEVKTPPDDPKSKGNS